MLAQQVETVFQNDKSAKWYMFALFVMYSLISFFWLVGVSESNSYVTLGLFSLASSVFISRWTMSLLILFTDVDFTWKKYLDESSLYVESLLAKLFLFPLFHFFFYQFSHHEQLKNIANLHDIMLLSGAVSVIAVLGLVVLFFVLFLVVLMCGTLIEDTSIKTIKTTETKNDNNADENSFSLNHCGYFKDEIINMNKTLKSLERSLFTIEENHRLETNIRRMNECLVLHTAMTSKEESEALVRNGFNKLHLLLDDMSKAQDEYLKNEIEKRVNLIK